MCKSYTNTSTHHPSLLRKTLYTTHPYSFHPQPPYPLVPPPLSPAPSRNPQIKRPTMPPGRRTRTMRPVILSASPTAPASTLYFRAQPTVPLPPIRSPTHQPSTHPAEAVREGLEVLPSIPPNSRVASRPPSYADTADSLKSKHSRYKVYKGPQTSEHIVSSTISTSDIELCADDDELGEKDKGRPKGIIAAVRRRLLTLRILNRGDHDRQPCDELQDVAASDGGDYSRFR
jgi:hypothetical protein